SLCGCNAPRTRTAGAHSPEMHRFIHKEPRSRLPSASKSPLAWARQQLLARARRRAVLRRRPVAAGTHRRHVHAVGRAQPRLVLVAAAGAEGASLVEADAHLLEAVAGAAAGNHDHVGLERGVGGHELVDELVGAHCHALADGADEAGWDLDLAVELAREVEIAVDTEARACPVLPVLVKYQPHARHDVQQAARHRCRHIAAIRAAAIAGPAALVLRP